MENRPPTQKRWVYYDKKYLRVAQLYKNTVIQKNMDVKEDSFYYSVTRFIETGNVKKYTVVCFSTNQKLPINKASTVIFVVYPNESRVHEEFIYTQP